MKRSLVLCVAGISSCLLMVGCMTPGDHLNAVRGNDSDKLTVAKVQKEIRVGMPSAEVASVLGSPNLVTTDAQRREVWVYDKVATERVYSTSEGGLGLILGGLGGGSHAGGFGGVGGSYSSGSGASSTNQRTLTIVIKFDNEGKVRDFSYRQSSF